MSGDDNIGGITNAYQSTVVMVDDQGWTVPFTQAQQFMGPQFVFINSDNRDITLYPNPSSFELKLPGHFRNVTSIEVVDILVQNPLSAPSTQYVPKGEMFYLLNGLLEQNISTGAIIENTFQPQNPNKFGRLYREPLALMKNQFGTNNSVLPYANFSGYFPNHAQDSFGRFRYLSTLPNQHWERLGSRKVNYYKPEIEKLDTLQVSLVGGDGKALYTAYPQEFYPSIPPNIALAAIGPYTWTATLMVQCRAS